MYKFNFLLSTILTLVLFFGCSGTYQKKTNPTEFNANVGTATAYDIKEKTRRLLMRYQYEIVREEHTYDQEYFESEWKNRRPFEDEIDLGIVAGRSRLTINAIPRTRTAITGSDLYVVRVYGENMVRFQGSDEWIRPTMTDMARKYFAKFAEDLRLELSTGIRKF